MSYVVKWRLSPGSKNRESPIAYRTPLEALDFACTILNQSPTEIWIEGPNNVRIEREIIRRHCQSRGSAMCPS